MMWIMGYNDGVESLNNIQDPLLHGTKHRPVLMPRLTTVQPCNKTLASIHNHSAHHHDHHLLALNHYHLAMAEHHRREQLISATQQVVVSSRWNPTPEQLQILEGLYRRGTRTPSAEEIQQIAAQLRRYGKIEGKNVFYWFQNHKARERQKRRRQLESFSSDEQPQINNGNKYYNDGTDQENVEKKDDPATGANRTPCEYSEEHQLNKNWPANPTILADQETFSAHEGTTVTKAECNKSDHGWAQFDVDDAELLHQRRNATWQFSSSSSSYPDNLINSCSVAKTVPSTVVRSQTYMTSSKIQRETVINNNVFFEPYCDHHKEAQTLLQLFPLRSDDDEEGFVHEQQEEEYGSSSALSTATASFTTSSPNYNNYQFFEFLPLKN